ncbi:MAG: hypothetical protein ACLQVY_02525 [Limisphaerales bacterium]
MLNILETDFASAEQPAATQTRLENTTLYGLLRTRQASRLQAKIGKGVGS